MHISIMGTYLHFTYNIKSKNQISRVFCIMKCIYKLKTLNIFENHNLSINFMDLVLRPICRRRVLVSTLDVLYIAPTEH